MNAKPLSTLAGPRAGTSQYGLSLVELLVSMAIGIFLIGGALSIYIKGREAYSINETLARMQENATFAFKQMEPDIQLAGFWGTHSNARQVKGRAQDDPRVAVLVGNDCDTNWSIRAREYLAGSNGERPAWTCLTADDYQLNTDVLTVRRASSSPDTTPDAGRLYVRSSSLPRSELFVAGATNPAGFPDEAQDFAVMAHAYYVRPYSIGDDGAPIPSLRRLGLAHVGGGMIVRDLEVVQGVENMQLQFGIDTNGTKAVDAYVNPDSALLAGGAEVLSVRVWLLLRADRPEAGYVDDATYVLGDVVRMPTEDNFRRMLVTRTILLRNRI